jgi:hypothetical protein
MRRLGLLVTGVGAAVLGLGTPALAEPSPSAAAAGPAAGTACTLSDKALTGLSGLLAQPNGGYLVANTSSGQGSPMRVYQLDATCKVTRTVSYPSANPPLDPQDLAVASDGTVWVADIGDNSTNKADRRQTIALWKVPAGNGTPVIHRLTYPDGPHDARALLFGSSDTPIIITKEPGGTAQLYQPTAPLQPNARPGVSLKNVGSWKPKRTGTANFLGATGQVLVTGAAQSPDRKRVVLRTYSDAYEWSVPDGDVVKAITTGEPRTTPLAGEAQGEGIAYSADGKSFLTVSNQAGPSKILQYQPAPGAAAAPAGATTGDAAAKTDGRSWYQKLSLPQVINIVAGIGLLGLVLVIVGVIGIRRSRNARRGEAGEARANPAGMPNDGGPRPVPVAPPGPGDPRQQNRPTVAPGDPRQQGRPMAMPGDPQRQGRPMAAPGDPQRQARPMGAPGNAQRPPGRPMVPPADPQRQGRPPVPPADPRRGGPAQPGRGGGGGNVYGGNPQPGYDQRGGRPEFTPSGYRPDYGGNAQFSSERL